MVNKPLAEKKLIGRSLDKLLGICEFALMDGVLESDEADNILKWLNNNQHCLESWPANILYDRLTACLQDGRLDPDEQSDLIGLIAGIIKREASSGEAQRKALLKSGYRAPGELKPGEYVSPSLESPLNQPPPAIEFVKKSFVFTGVFDFGSRESCIEATEAMGATVNKSVTKKLDYLVIGNVGSDEWRFASFGNKIMKACEYRDSGCSLAVISENHWKQALSI